MQTKHVTLLAVVAFAGLLSQTQAQTMIDLGSASSFAVLAGSAITVSGAATISGDLGSSPTPTITGSENVTFVIGENHEGDSFTQAAKIDLAAAYADAATRTGSTTVGAQLGGTTLTSGVYNAGTFGITGTLTLDAQGDPNAVWIFQAGSSLDTAIGSQVVLTGGAQAGNVFWQVGSSATFLASSVFVGNVMALSSITMGVGATVDGRLLAQNGAVTLDGDNSITAIPEPAVTSALVAGFVGLIVGIRRIRRRFSWKTPISGDDGL